MDEWNPHESLSNGFHTCCADHDHACWEWHDMFQFIHLHGLHPQRTEHDTSFDTQHQNIWINRKVSQLFSLNGFKFEHLLHWLTNTVKLRIILYYNYSESD